MIKRFDYVIFSQQSWDVEIGSNAKNIALELAKKNRVLYVNRPLDVKTLLKNDSANASFIKSRLKQRNSSIGNQIKEVENNLFAFTPKNILLSINGLPDGAMYDWANRSNNARLANEIKKAIAHLGFSDYVLLNDGELFNGFYLNELLDAKKSLYYYRDYFLAVPYWQKHGNRLESQIFERYDGVICNSEYLATIAAKHAKHSFFVGQGCDYDYFKDAHATEKLRNDKPIIGYVGALNSQRLDVSLLENLAQENPQWTWVFVGPEDEAFKSSSLHQQSNVVFTGSKNQEELAGYISQFDVALNPQTLNEVTIGNYPRKIDEYLYMGKPVVATRTVAMEMFAEFCFLVETKEEYAAAIAAALKQDHAALAPKRKAFAASHSWENSVNNIYNAISQL